MKNSFFEKLFSWYSIFNKLLPWLVALYALVAGIYKGIKSTTTSEMVTSILAGLIAGLFVILTSFAIDFGLNILDKSTDWLSGHVRKYPYARLWIIFPNILFAFYASYLVFRYLQIDLSLRAFISIYLIWILPSALISIIRDDMSRERARLSKEVSREIRIQNPQAAVENAFTHFEDHLLKRISGNSNLYGNKLIKAAFEGEKSKLVYKSDGKDYTTHLYNLMSGAYSIFRNPRHHKIIEDGEQKAQAIISVVELLIEFVDSSEEREIKQESEL